MEKHEFTFALPIKEITETMRNQFEREIHDRAKSIISKKISLLFLNKHSSLECSWYNQETLKEPDTGYCSDMINNAITDYVLKGDFEKYALAYIEKHWQAAMDKALDKAIEHAANKIAFTTVAATKKK